MQYNFQYYGKINELNVKYYGQANNIKITYPSTVQTLNVTVTRPPFSAPLPAYSSNAEYYRNLIEESKKDLNEANMLNGQKKPSELVQTYLKSTKELCNNLDEIMQNPSMRSNPKLREVINKADKAEEEAYQAIKRLYGEMLPNNKRIVTDYRSRLEVEITSQKKTRTASHTQRNTQQTQSSQPVVLPIKYEKSTQTDNIYKAEPVNVGGQQSSQAPQSTYSSKIESRNRINKKTQTEEGASMKEHGSNGVESAVAFERQRSATKRADMATQTEEKQRSSMATQATFANTGRKSDILFYEPNHGMKSTANTGVQTENIYRAEPVNVSGGCYSQAPQSTRSSGNSAVVSGQYPNSSRQRQGLHPSRNDRTYIEMAEEAHRDDLFRARSKGAYGEDPEGRRVPNPTTGYGYVKGQTYGNEGAPQKLKTENKDNLHLQTITNMKDLNTGGSQNSGTGSMGTSRQLYKDEGKAYGGGYAPQKLKTENNSTLRNMKNTQNLNGGDSQNSGTGSRYTIYTGASKQPYTEAGKTSVNLLLQQPPVSAQRGLNPYSPAAAAVERQEKAFNRVTERVTDPNYRSNKASSSGSKAAWLKRQCFGDSGQTSSFNAYY